jgi:hypothetical protein
MSPKIVTLRVDSINDVHANGCRYIKFTHGDIGAFIAQADVLSVTDEVTDETPPEPLVKVGDQIKDGSYVTTDVAAALGEGSTLTDRAALGLWTSHGNDEWAYQGGWNRWPLAQLADQWGPLTVTRVVAPEVRS